jgi:hypothetical protein
MEITNRYMILMYMTSHDVSIICSIHCWKNDICIWIEHWYVPCSIWKPSDGSEFAYGYIGIYRIAYTHFGIQQSEAGRSNSAFLRYKRSVRTQFPKTSKSNATVSHSPFYRSASIDISYQLEHLFHMKGCRMGYWNASFISTTWIRKERLANLTLHVLYWVTCQTHISNNTNIGWRSSTIITMYAKRVSSEVRSCVTRIACHWINSNDSISSRIIWSWFRKPFPFLARYIPSGDMKRQMMMRYVMLEEAYIL